MMNHLFNAIVISVLVGTVVMAPLPQKVPPSVMLRPTVETAARVPVMDDAAAKAAIEAYGYRDVTAIMKAADGMWRATAHIGTAEVQLVVDTSGKVSPD